MGYVESSVWLHYNNVYPEELRVTGDGLWGAAMHLLWLRRRVRSVRKELDSALGSP